ncbi:unnamed protein product [Hymenolepis diminuta]|uniref:Rho GDP-dissociation inhibitor 1 n=1 Tax=Hymenolepis diminuta TaxID=6216 RepID=A0A0R3SU57_HYMDI|nr:unnamed protein product [Hymenolepis diminuta]
MSAPEGDENELLKVEDGYKAPEKKTINEIVNMDAEDESLRRYKENLLGGAKIVNPCKLYLNYFINLEHIKPIEMPEGAQYHVEIDFYVNHEIVSGLRYAQKTTVDKVMLGSYGPRADPYAWRSEDEEVQSGMMFRGSYKVTSVFTDDDKHEHLKFTWEIKIVKSDK